MDWLVVCASGLGHHELQEEIKKAGKHARVVAKIEKPEAIEDLDAILEATDAVMVARGDLGVEMPMQEVPLLQKKSCASAWRWASPSSWPRKCWKA